MVVVKVSKFGNALGAVLAKEVIDRLQTREGAALFSSKRRKTDTKLRRTIQPSRKR